MENHLAINTYKLNIENFKERFRGVVSITLDDVVLFYEKFEKDVKRTTVKWRVHALVEKGIIQRIGRGKYRLGEQREFVPDISMGDKRLYSMLKKEFPYLDISIWNTQWVAQWMLHIPAAFETIIEVEKGSEENVFYFVSDLRKNVFINPQRDTLDRYAKTDEPIIIIKNLVTDSPLQKVGNVQAPTIEKIIVDLIVDEELYSAYQGRDLESILENSLGQYTINLDRLKRYAARRKKGKAVERVLNDNNANL